MRKIRIEQSDKKKDFLKLYLTGKYTQREIAKKLNISYVSINRWVKETPAHFYIKTRSNLAKQLDVISRHPEGKEELIFKYIEHLSILDGMIRKAKYIPHLNG